MFAEIHSIAVVERLIRMVSAEYAPFYYGTEGDNNKEMLCGMVTNFVNGYVLDQSEYMAKLPDRIPKDIRIELTRIKQSISQITGFPGYLLCALIVDFIIIPDYTGVIIVYGDLM